MGKTWIEVKVIAGSTVCWHCLVEALHSEVEYQEINLTATGRKHAQTDRQTQCHKRCSYVTTRF
jgi:hypothetical protein